MAAHVFVIPGKGSLLTFTAEWTIQTNGVSDKFEDSK